MASKTKDPDGSYCEVCGKPIKPGSTIGSTCLHHQGKIRSHAKELSEVPEGYVRMSEVCTAAKKAGLTINQVVIATGGDAATKPPLDPIFEVVYVGRRKWLHPDVLTKGFDLLRAGSAASAKPASPKSPSGAKPSFTDEFLSNVKSRQQPVAEPA